MDIKNTNEYLTEKSQSDNENDFLSRLIFLLCKDGQYYNSHFYNQNNELKEAVETCDSDIKQFLEKVIESINSKKINLSGVIDALGEIKEAQNLNKSEIKKSLAAVIRRNDESLFEGLREFASSILKNQELFDEKISSNSLDIASQSREIANNLVEMAKHIQKISIKYPSKMEIFGAVEIKKPIWWKEFSFSWEPIKELAEKIKSHTFKVNVENQIKFDEKHLKNLPDDVAKKLAKVLAENLPKIRISGGGMGNPFKFDEDGGLVVSGGATEAKQDDIIAKLPINDENRLKVSTLPGMPDACIGILTTTAVVATEVAGAGAVGGVACIAVDVSRASNVMFSLQNVGTVPMVAGQFAIEASLDSTDGIDGTWVAIQAVRSNSNTIVANTGTLTAAVGAGPGFGFEASVNANMWFRLRVTTNVTAGAAAKWTIIRGSYATEPIPAIQTHGVTLTTTSVGASTSAVGFSQFRNIAVSNTDLTVKATAGKVYSFEITNLDASNGAWLHLYNATIANVVIGTTVPVWSIFIPANSTRREYLTVPIQMATAISIAATTSADHTISTAPTTPLIVFIGFI